MSTNLNIPFAKFVPSCPAMKTILSIVVLILSGFANFAQAQVSSTEEAFALAKSSGRSVFLLGGQKS